MRECLTVLTAVLLHVECSGQGTMLFEADHPHFGRKSLTIDSRTGLTFLDITESLDMSIGQMRLETLPGGAFFGFRYASPGEVTSLYQTAGFGPTWVPIGSPEFGNVLRLIKLVGMTYEAVGYPATSGIMSDQTLAFIRFSVIPESYFVPDPAGKFIHANLDYKGTSLGHWLVVPEPSIMSLFTLSFGVFALHLRMHRAQGPKINQTVRQIWAPPLASPSPSNSATPSSGSAVKCEVRTGEEEMESASSESDAAFAVPACAASKPSAIGSCNLIPRTA